MTTIEEFERALSTLSIEEKYQLYRILEGQLPANARHGPAANSHSVLDIAPVHLGAMLRPPSGGDDPLEEMVQDGM